VRTSVLVYEVQPNDTVTGIAEKFGLDPNSILWANEKLADNPDFLSIGQAVNILPVDGAYHTVAAAETIESIANKYKVDPSAITGYGGNHLTASYVLQVGQKLIIPGGVKPYVPKRVIAYTGPIPKNAKKGTGSFVWPMSGRITQWYWQGHKAIDIGAPTGTPIYAADSGYVVSAQTSTVGYGRMVVIDHGNGYQTLYAHMQMYFVEVGQSVSKGERIGLCDSTGNSTGPHLHFEIRRNGVNLNPMVYLP
jgi:murein DD-endopeptidase MepM/ murein hydrolase activator NlpD